MKYDTRIVPTFHICDWELKKAVHGCIEYIKIGDKISTDGYLFKNNSNDVRIIKIVGIVNDIFYKIEDNYPGEETLIIKYISIVLDEKVKEELRKLTYKKEEE